MLSVPSRCISALLAACLGCSSPASEPLAPTSPAPTSPAPGPDLTQPWVTPAVSAPGVQRVVFRSAAVGGDVSYHVYLPPAYAAEPTRRFPVMYWLHGSGGGNTSIAPLAAQFAQAITDGLIPPMLVVMPNGLPGGMWVDDKAGRTPVESMVMRDLLPDVDARFRTRAEQAGRLIEGFSMGGYGALRLAFAHPTQFAAVTSLAGGPLQETFDQLALGSPAQRDQLMRDVYGNDMDYFRRVSPWVLAESFRELPVSARAAVRVVIGDRDPMVPLHATFEARLAALALPHLLVKVPGVGHEALPLMRGMADAYWAFYRTALGVP